MTTEQDFINVINAADDWRPHALALADWLEERGDPRARGWRWLVSEKKEPTMVPGFARPWDWWEKSQPENHNLHDVYRHLQEKMSRYATLSAALADAAQAAVKWLETQESS